MISRFSWRHKKHFLVTFEYLRTNFLTDHLIIITLFIILIIKHSVYITILIFVLYICILYVYICIVYMHYIYIMYTTWRLYYLVYYLEVCIFLLSSGGKVFFPFLCVFFIHVYLNAHI